MQELLTAHYINIEKSRIQVVAGDILKLLGEEQGGIDEHASGLWNRISRNVSGSAPRPELLS